MKFIKAKDKNDKRTYPIAIAGLVLSFVGGLFPAIQNSNAKKNFTPAFGFMNYEKPIMWYLFMALLVAGVICCAIKLEKIAIASAALSAVVYFITYNDICMLHGAAGMQNGLAGAIIITGTVVACLGAFIGIKPKSNEKRMKSGELDFEYNGNRSVWARMYINRGFYIMFLPVFIFVLLFNYWPMLGLRYAFTDFMSGKQPTYVGIKQFVSLFGLSPLAKLSSEYFMQALRNTLVLSITKLLLNTFLAVVISLLLNEMTHIIFKKTVQTIIYLPHFMSWVVVASIFKMILSASQTGMVNTALIEWGWIQEPIQFLTSPSIWRKVYYVINIWKDTGWGTILFLATLSGISPDLYEAAQIDGANRMKRMWYITMPALANTIITVLILNLAKVMNLFESVFVLYNDTVLNSSDVIQTYIYRQSFSSAAANYGYTTAVGLFKSVVGCILVLVCNKASKKVRGRGIV